MSNTPKIRFGGYTEDWNTRELGTIASAYSGGTPTASIMEYYNGDIPFIRSGEINEEKTELFLSELGYNNSSAAMVRKGDILYALYGATSGEVSISKLNGAINQAVLAIKPNEGYDAEFIMQWLKNQKGKIISTYLQGGQGNLSGAIVKSLKVDTTTDDEQKHIGTYFRNLDTLITLYHHEYEKLVSLKSSCLDKMFARKGDKTPELRFSGFAENWEQCKVSDLFDLLQNNTLSRAELSFEDGVAKNVHYGDVLVKFSEYLNVSQADLPYIVTQHIVDKLKGSLLQNGDIVMADTAEDETVGKCSEISGIQTIPIIAGLHTIPMRPKIKFASGYLGYYMNSDAYHDQLLPLMQGIKVTSVSKGAMQDTIVSFPSDIAEQVAIGQYFIRLDNLINLHQCKLKKLEQLKQSMLHNMFV